MKSKDKSKDKSKKSDQEWLDLLKLIKDQKIAEEKILKANRVYAVISQINQAIVRIHDTDKQKKSSGENGRIHYDLIIKYV